MDISTGKVDYSKLLGGSNAETGTGDFSSNNVPTYMVAADNHNYGNGNFAVTDPSTWGDAIANGGKLVTVGAASGINSFYNTGVAVANWFGADAKENDTATWIASLDDNLGKYYTEHKESADMAGFLMGSFVPGLGGIKILNAGQKALRAASETGMIGANLSRATGLLAPNVQAYTKLAAADIASSSATFSALSGNTLKAIKAGYGQAALESAAFETAVAATSFKSPVLDEADGWDIAKNIAVGTVTGGVIGGAINHAITVGAVKKAVKGINPVEKLFTDTTEVAGLDAAQRIIVRQNKLGELPQAPTAAQILEGKVPGVASMLEGLSQGDQQTVANNLATKFNRLRGETETSLQLKNRQDIHSITAGKDSELANSVADATAYLDSNQVFANFEHLSEIGRINTKLKAEAEVSKHVRDIGKPSAVIDIDNPPVAPAKIGFVKLHGEGAGGVTYDTPRITSIADSVANTGDVIAEVKSYRFKENKPWDAREASAVEADARYIWADKYAQVQDGMKIHEYDFPLLEKAIEQKVQNINVISDLGNYPISTSQDIFKHLQVSKQEAAAHLLGGKKAGTGVSTEEIAKITNTRQSLLNGEIDTANPANDYFARQMDKAEYVKDLKAKGIWKQEKEDNFGLTPQYAKVAYDTKILKDADGNVVSGMAYIKGMQKQYQLGIDNVFATHMPATIVDRFWHPTDSTLLGADRYGAGPGVVSFANGNYGTLSSWAESIGSSSSAAQKAFKDVTSTSLESHLYNIANDQEVAIGFESVNKFLQSSPELYGLNPAGTGIEPLKMLDWKAAIARGEKAVAPELGEGVAPFLPIENQKVLAAWNQRTKLTGPRTQAFQDIRNAQGLEDMKDPRALRPIRQDPKDYPYYAVVVDPTVSGVGHKSMIHAATPRELEAMINKVPSQFEVLKGDQLKQYFKAHGEFDYEQTLHENYIDASLRSNGVNNPFFMRTDPQKIAQSFLQDHIRSDDIFARELVNAKYEKEFSFLRQQGEQYTNTATSKYLGSYREIENTTQNPYVNYIKTALNISQMSEHPLLSGLNTKLDQVYSSAMNLIRDTYNGTKSVEDLDKVNVLLTKYGVSSGYRDAATELLANHTAPKGDLVRFVSRANTIMSTLVTRLDPMNSINNAVGATVLYGAETRSVLRAIEQGDASAVGELSKLVKMPAPSAEAVAGKAGDTVGTAGKLMLNATKNFFDRDAKTLAGEPLKEFYARNGWSTRLTDQFHQVMDNIALEGTENAGLLSTKINAAFKLSKELAEKGEVATGNKLAEEFNRFVAADTMRQISDVGVKAGVITPQEQLGYINSFVNRTQGNILASQRPLMFQGAVGQAIGLFQSFQFNTMQQLFRHVAEGSSKDAALMMGLQSTMYGMNGLPAFNFLNTHIVGTLSGNPQHRDMYDSTYGIAGKSIGDMLLYGIPSNMLRGNLYSRGDINPRQLTVVPTNPLDIPFVNATIKMYDNVKGMLGKDANGGNLWQGFLQGIEHNGLSRPLAGAAQVAQAFSHDAVFSTSNKGNMSGANDLFSWASAIRLAGGKPFDDAVANDGVFRIQAYQAADHAKMDALNGAIKSTMIGNKQPDDDQVQKFAEKYAALGGKQTQFNKYMMKQFKDANTVQANAIVEKLRSPYAQKMQQIMGGDEMLDGRSFAGE